VVLKRAPGVINEVTGGQGTVGLRSPSHPIAQELLHAFGGGIAAPSANRFGRISPTRAQHVREDLGDAVDLILDAGSCEVGIESTILDLSSGKPVLLRPGHIGIESIQAVLRLPVSRHSAHSPRASGTLAAHYAPRTALRLAPASDLLAIVEEESRNGSTAVLARSRRPQDSHAAVWQVAPSDPIEYAHALYASLRLLDNSECAVIVAEDLPRTPEWEAVRDRLGRAAAGSGASENDAGEDAT
jgi:L-threonylcarbamoyladenylate synthase